MLALQTLKVKGNSPYSLVHDLSLLRLITIFESTSLQIQRVDKVEYDRPMT